ncbi:MAG: ADP-ribosylglycohydrolase family protein, partial [Microbacteriaceae bacterium]|nr:ADP-ribosylglycohydrolase family protein [Microbacteriaceae bacterium]
FDPDAGDACVLWCLAIRAAVLDGSLDVRVGLGALPANRREQWAARIDEAEVKHPRDFDRNGWVVQALQGAWSAITHGSGLVDILERTVRGGRDTDTVAAIAGALAGASLGASAVPSGWRRIVHGWSGLRARGLIDLSVLAARGGQPDDHGWPTGARFDYSSWGDTSALVRHPHDDGVWLGAVGALDALPAEIEAVVSLCRVGSGQARVPAGEHIEIWLIDDNDPAKNLNLDLVLSDAADAVAAFRAEGKTVLLHCVQAQSRTPSVGALYAARHLGIPVEDALREVVAALPDARPKEFLVAAVRRLAAR